MPGLRAKHWLVIGVASFLYYQAAVDINNEVFFDTVDFIRKYGYPAEIHSVQSADGYLVTLHRIPHGPGGPGKAPRPVVFLQHGLMCTSDVWVYRGPGKDLPFILVDEGYDVWLGNVRGNFYSNKHINTSITQEEYWNFSWHEMGFYDLPAIIDYILHETKEKDLSYIGHSMGTTIFLVMASTRPEYNSKINTMVALAPVATKQNYTTSLQHIFTNIYLYTGSVLKMLGIYQVTPRASFKAYFVNLFCKDKAPTQFLCKGIHFGLAGESYLQYNSTALTIIMSHGPTGHCDNQIIHYHQTWEKGKFIQRDFGGEENLRRYNQLEPPEYDLNKVTSPSAVYYADNDQLAPVQGVLQVARQLPKLVRLHRVAQDSFNHLDFMWGTTAKQLVYDDIVKLFAQPIRNRVEL